MKYARVDRDWILLDENGSLRIQLVPACNRLARFESLSGRILFRAGDRAVECRSAIHKRFDGGAVVVLAKSGMVSGSLVCECLASRKRIVDLEVSLVAKNRSQVSGGRFGFDTSVQHRNEIGRRQVNFAVLAI